VDDFSKRAIGNLNDRHREKAKAEAEQIREYAGYLLRDLEAGRVSSTYARSILDSAQAVVVRLAALEAVKETTGILAAEDAEAKP
jgi:hypothetical protein